VGSGKTGIDAVLWLLAHNVPPERVRWIIPRDAWMLDRGNFQTDPASFAVLIGSIIAQLRAIEEAMSASDLFRRLEQSGQLVRLDPNVEPTAYKCCTVSLAELLQLRRVTEVVRLGHVSAVHADAIELSHGRIPLHDDEVLVDCSARAVVPPPPLPIFAPGRINLLMIRTCQPTFSGALIGLVAFVGALLLYLWTRRMAWREVEREELWRLYGWGAIALLIIAGLPILAAPIIVLAVLAIYAAIALPLELLR
jgi:hypothetical protein